jgi:hypothetical protein
MKSTGTARQFVVAVAILACSAVSAATQPPKVLREPVLGLRYDVENVKFDALPQVVSAACPDLVTDRVGRRAWIFASAKQSSSSYYVIGGYFERRFPRPPNYPKYELDELGAVLRIEGSHCTLIGPARETFTVRALDDTPATVLQLLSTDLVHRLETAFGGSEQLRKELRNQHIDGSQLPFELKDSLNRYLAR